MVTTPTLDDVRELSKIRTALEMLAASEATRHLHEDALDEFELLPRRMERAQGDPKQWVARHEAFHPDLRLDIDVYRHTEMPGYEHRSLLAAIARRDPEQASRAMREHIEYAAAGVPPSSSRASARPMSPAPRAGGPTDMSDPMPDRQEFSIPGLNPPISHYSDAVRFGNLLFISGIAPLDLINPVRQKYFGKSRPASTLFEVSRLAILGMKVEIEAIVGLPG